MKLCPYLTCLLFASLLILPKIAWCETHVVEITNARRFSPRSVTIEQGDTVQWVWKANGHDVVSGKKGRYNKNFRTKTTGSQGDTFQVIFNQKFLNRHPVNNNRYNYYCTPHWEEGMTGSIRVRR